MLVDPAIRPPRRLLRPSIRSLILFVLVFAIGLAWLVHGARIQRDAVRAIREAGGIADYDWALAPRMPPGIRPEGTAENHFRRKWRSA
jgi:hypothetical protein